jgi:hypothetical protein
MNAEVTEASSQGIGRRDVICRVTGASLSLLGFGLAQDREHAGAAAAACEGLLKKHDVPGAVIAFAERGEIRCIVAKGLADKGSERPMGADTRFEADLSPSRHLRVLCFACASRVNYPWGPNSAAYFAKKISPQTSVFVE